MFLKYFWIKTVEKIKQYYKKQSNFQFIFGLICIFISSIVLEFFVPGNRNLIPRLSVYLFFMIFLLAGFLFLSYGAKIRANPYRNIRKLLSGEINAKLHFEAEYIDLHSFNFTSRIVKMTKVRFHIYGSRNNKYYMLLNLEDYFQIIKFLK